MKMVADRHRHAAYHNKHCSVRFVGDGWRGTRVATPQCMRTTSPLELVWGVGFDSQKGSNFQEQLDKMWGYKNVSAHFACTFISVPTFKFVTPPLFVHIISIALNLVS